MGKTLLKDSFCDPGNRDIDCTGYIDDGRQFKMFLLGCKHVLLLHHFVKTYFISSV